VNPYAPSSKKKTAAPVAAAGGARTTTQQPKWRAVGAAVPSKTTNKKTSWSAGNGTVNNNSSKYAAAMNDTTKPAPAATTKTSQQTTTKTVLPPEHTKALKSHLQNVVWKWSQEEERERERLQKRREVRQRALDEFHELMGQGRQRGCGYDSDDDGDEDIFSLSKPENVESVRDLIKRASREVPLTPDDLSTGVCFSCKYGRRFVQAVNDFLVKHNLLQAAIEGKKRMTTMSSLPSSLPTTAAATKTTTTRTYFSSSSGNAAKTVAVASAIQGGVGRQRQAATAPPGLLAAAAAAVSSLSSARLSLKAKLREDIEKLRRAQEVKKLKLEDERRRKREEKLTRKRAAEQEKKNAAQQKNDLVAALETAEQQQPQQTPNAAVAASTSSAVVVVAPNKENAVLGMPPHPPQPQQTSSNTEIPTAAAIATTRSAPTSAAEAAAPATSSSTALPVSSEKRDPQLQKVSNSIQETGPNDEQPDVVNSTYAVTPTPTAAKKELVSAGNASSVARAPLISSSFPPPQPTLSSSATATLSFATVPAASYTTPVVKQQPLPPLPADAYQRSLVLASYYQQQQQLHLYQNSFYQSMAVPGGTWVPQSQPHWNQQLRTDGTAYYPQARAGTVATPYYQAARRTPQKKERPGASHFARFAAPNPFFNTHAIHSTVVILKKPGESFGVTLRLETETGLVKQDWYEKTIVQQSSSVKADAKDTKDNIRSSPSSSATISDSTKILTDAGTKRSTPTTATEDTTEAESVKETYAKPLGLEPSASHPSAAVPEGGPMLTASNSQSTGSDVKPQIKRAPRRRRFHFSALAILDASKQNSLHPDSSRDTLLKQGDIVLQIDGTDTAGLTFDEALSLIKNCKNADESGTVRCSLLVARRINPLPVKTAGLSITYSSAAYSAVSVRDLKIPFNEVQLESFARCLLHSNLYGRHVLGTGTTPADDERLQALITAERTLESRSLQGMKLQWASLRSPLEAEIYQRASAHWKSEWKKEAPSDSHPGEPMTDAQRSLVRNAPRPAVGCRCGASDHEYVNDLKCRLYGNLRRLASVDVDVQESDSNTRKSNDGRELKVLEKAFKDRLLRIKEEHQAEERETRFVQIMEEIQVNICNQAIFSPSSLSAMILSTVVELRDAFEREAGSKVPTNVSEKPSAATETAHADSSDSDSDDDIPLAALGKRASSAKQSPSKKRKLETKIRLKCLAMILKALGERWGHVYREPSDEDYAW